MEGRRGGTGCAPRTENWMRRPEQASHFLRRRRLSHAEKALQSGGRAPSGMPQSAPRTAQSIDSLKLLEYGTTIAPATAPQDGAEDRGSGSGECHSGEKPLTLLT